ncbi:MAG TPA: low affinity iron permease family protein [Gemmatimonadaceae bacterium]
MHAFFRRFAQRTSTATGSAWAFLTAVIVIIAWAATGPLFHYSDTWQLVINTGTTIVTFLMVFLIQNTQNRDATAMQLKLDELLRAVEGARTRLVDLEDLSDDQLAALRRQFQMLREHTEREVGRTANGAADQRSGGGRRMGDPVGE